MADTCRQGLGALRSMEDWAGRAPCRSVVFKTVYEVVLL